MNLFADLAPILRRLWREPAYAATVVLLLGIALAANGGVFAVLYGLLYKPLPFPHEDRLVTVSARFMGIDGGVSLPLLDAIARDAKGLDGIAGFQATHVDVGDATNAQAASIEIARVQPQLFTLLGAHAAAGRLFEIEDAREGAARSVVLGWDAWQQRYGGAADTIGRTIDLDGEGYRIVGVLPRGFAFPERSIQAWTPFVIGASDLAESKAGSFGSTYAIARLAPGADRAAVRHEVEAVARALPGLQRAFDEPGRFAMEVGALRDVWVGEHVPALRLMLLAVGLVLLVTAANLCNLAIARATARRHAIAVQQALGAGRSRQIAQAAGEAFALCALAAGLALVLLPAVLMLLARFELLPVDAPQAIGIDVPTVAVLLGLAFSAALAITFASLGSQRGLQSALGQSGRRQTAGRGAQRVRQGLIVGQIALTAALLVGIGLLLRSSQHLLAEDVGFDRDNLVHAGLGSLGGRSVDDTTRIARVAALVDAARAMPGVVAAGVGSQVPFGDNVNLSSFQPPGAAIDGGRSPNAYDARVDAGYFAALGMPILRGRAFGDDEARGQSPVAIVDEGFVRRYSSDRDPLGRTFLLERPPLPDGTAQAPLELTIVGVVATTKRRGLDESDDYATIYRPQAAPLSGALLVRTSASPDTLVAPLRELFARIAPDGSPGQIIAMHHRIAATLAERDRLNALLQGLGAIALALAVLGLYAVLAYAVRMREAEFGVRMALGADARRILRGVLAQGLALVGLGLLVGVPLVVVATRLVAARLHGVAAYDVVTLVGVAAVLGTVAMAACWLPARRAARVDPIAALRNE